MKLAPIYDDVSDALENVCSKYAAILSVELGGQWRGFVEMDCMAAPVLRLTGVGFKGGDVVMEFPLDSSSGMLIAPSLDTRDGIISIASVGAAIKILKDHHALLG